MERFLYNFGEAVSIARSSMTRDIIPYGQVGPPLCWFFFVRVFVVLVDSDHHVVVCNVFILNR